MKPLDEKLGAADFDGSGFEVDGVIDDINGKYLRERKMFLKAQEWLISRAMSGGNTVNPKNSLLDIDNITGCFIGIKKCQGISTGELALVVTVVIKSSAIDEVAERALIPPHVSVDGYSVVTDVIEDGVGRFTVQCGSLMGPLAANREQGTIGAIVQRNGSVKKYVLSNSHVLSDFGLNAIGTKFYSPPKAPDVGGVHVCTLSHNISLLKYNSNFPNENFNIVDCALGTATANAQSSFAGGIGVINPSPTALLLNAPVMMCGAKTGFRTGLIVGVDSLKLFGFKDQPGKQYNFKSLYAISPTDNKGVFADFGDSGALLLSSSKRPVGLIIGRGEDLSYACKINNVMQKLNIKNFVQ